ncbi:hypothetical protein AB4Z10_22190 [Bosea sp. RAF48]|uniref:hypothetical protein n=1 Tax=Bosea sp. RAF48 TaxID=3237480 RepID=UPI003F90F50D
MKADETGGACQKHTFKRQIGFHAIIFVRAVLASYSRCAATSQAPRDDFDTQGGCDARAAILMGARNHADRRKHGQAAVVVMRASIPRGMRVRDRRLGRDAAGSIASRLISFQDSAALSLSPPVDIRAAIGG